MSDFPEAPPLRRFLRISQVEAVTGLRKSAIYARIKRGAFPKAIPLGNAPNSAVAWIDSEIAEWQSERLRYRRLSPDGNS